MACKKSELISAINSYASARVTGDRNLQEFSAQLLEDMINSLEYEAEDELVEDVVAEAA